MPRRSFLLKSSLSNALFEDFTSSYQSLKTIDDQQKPFVYVDHDGVVKLLTNVVGADENDEGIFAVSVAEDGFMEFLALQDA
jgi:hypothetical protein